MTKNNELPVSASLLLGQIDELRSKWIDGIQLSQQVLGRLKRSTLITSTGASTRIEGSALSDEEVEKVMRGMAIQKLIDRDEQEVGGYFELLEGVFHAWKYMTLSENVIKQLHAELLKYTNKDERHRGEYKKMENAVEMYDEEGKFLAVVFKTAPAYLTPKLMNELVERTAAAFEKKEEHPLIILGNFIVEFLAIHPFQDGNGRLSRILTNLLLLKMGYEYIPYVSQEKLIEDRKTDYYVALRRTQLTLGTDSEDRTPWLEFFLNILLEQARQAVAILSHASMENVLSPMQIIVWHYIESHESVTAGEIAKNANVVRITVSQALQVLLRLKKIERLGVGRTTRYRKI